MASNDESLVVAAGEKEDSPISIAIMGPTASGKTGLAIELVRHLPCEIISVDSALVYRGMDIGTAKPSAEELAIAPHHLIDIRDPSEPYSAADFRSDCLSLMDDITARSKIPLLVGGTMLYFKALQEGLSPLPSADEKVRKKFAKVLEEKGLDYLHQQLAEVDPESAARIHKNDPQRILRALEVFEISGQPMSVLWQQQQAHRLPYRLIKLIQFPEDRSVLHQRIELRFKQMLDNGFIDEVKQLQQNQSLDINWPSMRSVGYRQALEFLDGQYDYDELVKRGIYATRQLAKRQITWLRKEKDGNFYDPETLQNEDLLQKLKNSLS